MISVLCSCRHVENPPIHLAVESAPNSTITNSAHEASASTEQFTEELVRGNQDCVIFENSDVISGQALWDEFIENTHNLWQCSINLSFRNIDTTHEYVLYYDGLSYTLTLFEGDEEIVRSYKYLKQYFSGATIMYILLDDYHLTMDQIWSMGTASDFGDSVPVYRLLIIYSDYVYTPPQW